MNTKELFVLRGALSLLEECAAYFAERADADGDQDGYHANTEMSMQMRCDAAVALLAKAVEAGDE